MTTTDTNKQDENSLDIKIERINSEQSLDGENILEDTLSSSQTISQTISDIQKQLIDKQAEADKFESIAKATQQQYMSLRLEFDSLSKKIEIERSNMKKDQILKIFAKVTGLLENLRQFISNLPQDLQNHSHISGLVLTYEKFINTELAGLGIHPIQSLGLIPDALYHEVMMTEPATTAHLEYLKIQNIKVDDKTDYSLEDLSGKIIREFEIGYYYLDGEAKYVIRPSKVLVAL